VTYDRELLITLTEEKKSGDLFHFLTYGMYDMELYKTVYVVYEPCVQTVHFPIAVMRAGMVWPARASQETRITLALHHLAVGPSLSACWTLHI
jgi:hypothetical protein